jgi:hypothetical protein
VVGLLDRLGFFLALLFLAEAARRTAALSVAPGALMSLAGLAALPAVPISACASGSASW